MTHTEAIEKVRKLLSLSQSDNPHEAALAASRVQEIMDRYQLDQAMLELSGEATEPEEGVRQFVEEMNPGEQRLATWKLKLASTIARANGCRIVCYGPQLRIVGRSSDATTVRCLFSYLAHETNRLAKRYCKGEGHTYAANFRLGVVDTIKLKLEAEHLALANRLPEEARAKGGNAIQLVSNGLARVENKGLATQQWMYENLFLTQRHNTGPRTHHLARAAGQAAGREIQTHAGCRPALGSGR